MVKKRVFIAINLPPDLKKKINRFRIKWNFLPFRWVSEANLHLTLIFIGYVDDDQLYHICQLAREAARRSEPFVLEIERFCYGPPDKPPRMVWLEGRPSRELAELKNNLEKALLAGSSLDKEPRPFRPHITLGRLLADYRASDLPPAEEFEEKNDYHFSVETVEVMVSNLRKTGAEYAVFESAPLGKES